MVLDTVRLLVEMGDSSGGSSGGGNGGGGGRTEKILHRDYKPIGRPASNRALTGSRLKLNDTGSHLWELGFQIRSEGAFQFKAVFLIILRQIRLLGSVHDPDLILL